MFALQAAVTPLYWLIAIGVGVLGWSLFLSAYGREKRRAERLIGQHQQQLDALSLLAQHREQQREKYGSLLVEANRELLNAATRHAQMEARLAEIQQSNVACQALEPGSLPPGVREHHRAAADAEHAGSRRLEAALAEMRRGRELAEQRAERLRIANQVQMREIASLSAQLEQLALSMEDARLARSDKETRVAELEQQLSQTECMLHHVNTEHQRLRDEVQGLTQGREQLELQNLDLKRVLEQLQRPHAVESPALVFEPRHESAPEIRLGARDEWQKVTESDIGQAIVSVTERARPIRAESSSIVNSGTYAVARPAESLASESRELKISALEAVVLSDNLGLPIAGLGSVSSESLAAVSGLALSNAERVRELLPVGPIETVQWVDQYGTAVTCKLLHLAGDEMAMTTIGVGTPTEQVLRETLRNVLCSIGWNDKGPVIEHESNAATG